jgi:hypothetical protein
LYLHYTCKREHLQGLSITFFHRLVKLIIDSSMIKASINTSTAAQHKILCSNKTFKQAEVHSIIYGTIKFGKIIFSKCTICNVLFLTSKVCYIILWRGLITRTCVPSMVLPVQQLKTESSIFMLNIKYYMKLTGHVPSDFVSYRNVRSKLQTSLHMQKNFTLSNLLNTSCSMITF